MQIFVAMFCAYFLHLAPRLNVDCTELHSCTSTLISFDGLVAY
jgi:hypothetical protein